MGFQKQTKKTSTSFLFKALAVADTLVIITVYPADLMQHYDFERLFYYFPITITTKILYICYKFFVWFGQLTILLSNGITVLLTVTRLVAVCFPLYTQRICSITRVRCYLITMIILVVGCYIPFLYYGFIFDMDTFTIFLYFDIFRPIVFCGIPLLIIKAMPIKIMIKLKILNQRRINMTFAQRRRNNATLVLIAVNIVF